MVYINISNGGPLMNQRKHYSPEQKVEILREHLENQISLSELAERYGIHPTIIHRWKKQLFEGALNTFSQQREKTDRKKDVKIKHLEDVLKDRDGLIADIVTDNVRLKKKLNGGI